MPVTDLPRFRDRRLAKRSSSQTSACVGRKIWLFTAPVVVGPNDRRTTGTLKFDYNMHPLRPAGSPLQRLQAKATLKPINFFFLAGQAKEAFLIGDFNDWNPASHPMKKGHDGAFHISITLGHGGHHYQFLVDGKCVNDPRAQGLARNEKGEKVSLILVS